jgi:hypothetical protein
VERAAPDQGAAAGPQRDPVAGHDVGNRVGAFERAGVDAGEQG